MKPKVHLLVLIIAFSVGGCASTGPSLGRTEVVHGEKQLNRATSDYFFDSMTRIVAAGNKILEHLPNVNAKEAHAALPFLVIDLNFEFQRWYETGSSNGVMVAGILEGFGADTLDVRRGDEILSIDNVAVKSEKDILRFLRKMKGRESVVVHLRRGGRDWKEQVPLHYLRKKLPFVLNGTVQDIAAYTDQRGFVYVTPSVLDFAQNKDELAFVLARQVAYVMEKHIAFTSDLFGTRESVRLGSAFNYYFHGRVNDGFVIFEPLGKLRLDHFSEKEEREADQAALEYVALSGFDGGKAVQFYERLVIEKAKKISLTYGMKVPSAERLILLRRLAAGGAVASKVTKEDKKAVAQQITQKSLDAFLDKTLRVTGIGHRILQGVPKEGDLGVAVLPLLALDIKDDYREFYNVRSDKGVMVAGLLGNPGGKRPGEIRRGDEILAVNGLPVSSESGLAKALQSLQGDEARLRLRRGSREWERSVPIYRIAKNYSFSVMKDEQNVNAFADAFGGITVTTSLLRFVETEDHLAFVLAHEIAHLTHHHIAKNMANQVAGMAVGVTLGAIVEAYAPGFGNLAGSLSSGLMTSPYSKQLEREADYHGLEYLKSAGYAPEKAYSIWEKFAAAIPGSRERSIISTHPASPERFLRLRKAVEEITGTPLPMGSRARPESTDDRLGPMLASEADPQKVGMIEAGLAEDVDNFVLGVRAKGEGSVFPANLREIVWYAKFDPTGGMKHYVSRKYRIQWYQPDGTLFYEEEFKAGLWNETLAKATLRLNPPLDTKLIGRWRVRVWKKDRLVDDRYFQIINPKAEAGSVAGISSP
jgi:Zn-dependent protease with chaperone function